MIVSSETVTDVPANSAPGGRLFSDGLMPLGPNAQLFFSLAPDSSTTNSLAMMNDRFASRLKNAVWLPIKAEQKTFLSIVEALNQIDNVAGMAVWDPFQLSFVNQLDQISPRARIVGAADVARRTGGNRWEGDMAGISAFRRTLRSEGIDPRGGRVWLMGTTGSASAAAFALAEGGISALTITGIAVDSAVALASRIGQTFPGVSVTVGVPGDRSIDLVVNGLTDFAETVSGIEFSSIPKTALILDAVARTRISPFADRFSIAGWTVVSGDCLLEHLMDIHDEFFAGSRISYKDGSLLKSHLVSA